MEPDKQHTQKNNVDDMIWIDLILFAVFFFGFGWILRAIDEGIYWIKGLFKRKETEEE
jgi:hypothetical protein